MVYIKLDSILLMKTIKLQDQNKNMFRIVFVFEYTVRLPIKKIIIKLRSWDL